MSANVITFFYRSVQNWSINGGGRNCPKFSAVQEMNMFNNQFV